MKSPEPPPPMQYADDTEWAVMGSRYVIKNIRVCTIPLLEQRQLQNNVTKDEEYIIDRLSKDEEYIIDRLSKDEEYIIDRLSKDEEYIIDRLSKDEEYIIDRLSKDEEYIIDRLSKDEEYIIDRLSKDVSWKCCKILGSLIDTEEDVKQRKKLALDAMSAFKEVWRCNQTNRCLKIRIFEALVQSIFLYNSEI